MHLIWPDTVGVLQADTVRDVPIGWGLAELGALKQAVETQISTVRLGMAKSANGKMLVCKEESRVMH